VLFGPSGCGKTTLLRIIAGQLQPGAGLVRLYGRPPRASRARMEYVRQLVGASSLFTPQQIIGQKLARHNVASARRAAYLAEAIELMDISEVRDRPLRELSYGMRAAATLAAALAPRPALLLLDGSGDALPMPLMERLETHLADRQAADGLTVFQATVFSATAEQADRVWIMDGGELLVDDNPARLLAAHGRHELVIEASDPETVQRTLRGIFDVEITPTRNGLRLRAADGMETAAGLFRQPSGGVRVVTVQPPSLWDVMESLQKGRSL
jgi:ABC-type multidrug transport system ATPase subunit